MTSVQVEDSLPQDSHGPADPLQETVKSKSVTEAPPSTISIAHTAENAKATNEIDENQGHEERGSPTPSLPAIVTPVPTTLTLHLYISHFLSTWNSRLFEFGTVLVLAAIFPNTLLPLSIYALVRSSIAILFSSAVGTWIDTGDRLNVVRVSILGQRVAVGTSCALFWVMLKKGDLSKGLLQSKLMGGLFAAVVLLACVEKLCSVMNLVAVERDWVVAITEGNADARRVINARMRRIDLFCKLLGPLIVALINGASTLVAIWVTLGLSAVSIPAEYFCIASVFAMVPLLRRSHVSAVSDDVELSNLEQVPAIQPRRLPLATYRSVFARVFPYQSYRFYFQHAAFLPSFSLSLLYLTVLSFSGQMVTFLLDSSYTSRDVGIARTVSTIFELSATWIAPRVTKRIGVLRAGIYFLTWQMLFLAGGVTWFFADGDGLRKRDTTVVSGLVGGVILSRVGLWGFDLSTQNLIQDKVDTNHRGAFSTVEASFQNLFELLSYVSTVIFSQPNQFQWPVVISTAAVFGAGGLYAMYLRKQRGHWFHSPPFIIHPHKGSSDSERVQPVAC